MSFWSGLGKILSIAGPIAAIPFTGGASAGLLGMSAGTTAAALGGLGMVGGALGAAGKGRADARVVEGAANNQYDRTAADLFRAQTEANTQKNKYLLDANAQKNTFGLNRVNAGVNLADADLARRKFALTAPGARAGNAVRGDILSNAQDVSISGLAPGHSAVQFAGGLRPSMFSADTRAMGANMSHQARTEQEAGDHFDALPDLPDYSAAPGYLDGPAAPSMTPQPQAGKLDSILNTAGTMGNIANLLSTLPYQRKPSARAAVDPNDENGWG